MDNNQVLDAIYERRSIRKYKDKDLSKEQIEALVRAALLSPSSRNKQPWKLSVLTNKDLISEYEEGIIQHFIELGEEWIIKHNEARGNKIFYDAPVVFVISMKEGSGIDVGIMAQSIAIAAKGMGLDSVILGFPRVMFAEQYGDKWANILEFPEGYVYGISVAVGYGAEEGRQRDPDYSKVSYLK